MGGNSHFLYWNTGNGNVTWFYHGYIMPPPYPPAPSFFQAPRGLGLLLASGSGCRREVEHTSFHQLLKKIGVYTMAVLSSAADGGTAQKVASLTWSEETIEVETCGRSYWSFLQRARAIDNKQLGNVSAFTVDDEVDEEVCWVKFFRIGRFDGVAKV